MTDKGKIVPLKNFYVGVDERFHVAVREIAGNDWVEHADYAALESKFAAQAARIEQLTASLTRMLEMHDLMMEKVNFGASFFDTECLMEMNAAPVQALSLLGGVQL